MYLPQQESFHRQGNNVSLSASNYVQVLEIEAVFGNEASFER
jgi:hypothetical protein